MYKTKIAAIALMFIVALRSNLFAKNVNLESPDGTIIVNIEVDNTITYSVTCDGKQALLPCPISLTIEGIPPLGPNPKLIDVSTSTNDQILTPVTPTKTATIRDNYNETVLEFEGSYSLIFRAYDTGIAYRFFTSLHQPITVLSEQVDYNFPDASWAYFPEEEELVHHHECYYQHEDLKKLAGKTCIAPILIELKQGPKLLITEADLDDYPGTFFKCADNYAFKGQQAKCVLEYKMNDRYLKTLVEKRADYIAKTTGTRTFPWRVTIIARTDADLLLNQLIYQLGKPLALNDTSWIKPGKVSWDWYNANNIYGVDFRAGINTDTYKYYIDFASKYGLEYVIFDEGWYTKNSTDVLDIIPEMDMEGLFKYAKDKNVGIILWVGWKCFDDKFEQAMRQFEKWGVAGIKVDFMMRDDQDMVNFFTKVAQRAAQGHMLVDFHGSYKPDGLRRTYPNLITREGLKGLENNKWKQKITPEHCLTIPFIRMVTGPIDFTPGAMNNAQKENHRAIFDRPMSQGTRCMQLAMYVLYESPLQMLADCPSAYLRETETMEYLAAVPTTWDETIVLDAKIAEYLVMARRKGDQWYLAALTDWTPREFDVDLSFLADGNYQADIYQDGINADRDARDYKRLKQQVTKQTTLKLKLAPGGGYAARISN